MLRKLSQQVHCAKPWPHTGRGNKSPMMRIAAIALNAVLELGRRQAAEELGEDALSGIHPSLSAIGAACSLFKSKNTSRHISPSICITYKG
jgi:hypothetical protein